jgi:hypothetical protein
MIKLLIINVSGINPEQVLFPDYEINKFPNIIKMYVFHYEVSLQAIVHMNNRGGRISAAKFLSDKKRYLYSCFIMFYVSTK